eukprot:COSAG06_NODE_1054_length_10948_cov_36.868006_3_plen_47_part_00
MFVPSLSWQNDHFYIKSGQKVPFSHLDADAEPLIEESLRENKRPPS